MVRSPTGSVVRFPLPRDDSLHAVVVRRLDLDAALLKHTRSFDVEVLEGEGIAAIDPGADGIEVTTSGGRTIAAGRIIAADGMWSATRKLSGDTVDRYRGDWHAFRQYFTGVTGPAADDLWVSFEPDILPGYFWSFPWATAGPMWIRHHATRRHLAGQQAGPPRQGQAWPELLIGPISASCWATRPPGVTPPAWPIPARIGDLPWWATGCCTWATPLQRGDPMTGEGIAQALVTGRLAAEAVVAGGAGVEANYEQAARAALLADHRMSVAFHPCAQPPQRSRRCIGAGRRNRLDPTQLRPLAVLRTTRAASCSRPAAGERRNTRARALHSRR
ncbi:MAG: hypothetical protein IPQ14_01955 [Candidatus Microthrix sp.]|nr:hypothetical protein [Candidatus Microthrix sp.]